MLNIDIRLELSLLSRFFLGDRACNINARYDVSKINGARVPGWLLELNMTAQTGSLAPDTFARGSTGLHNFIYLGQSLFLSLSLFATRIYENSRLQNAANNVRQ